MLLKQREEETLLIADLQAFVTDISSDCKNRRRIQADIRAQHVRQAREDRSRIER
jgi:hypothetical protein